MRETGSSRLFAGSAAAAETRIDGLRLDHPHTHAAVDHKILAGDEVILQQRLNQAGDLVGLALAAQRNAVAKVCCNLLRSQMTLKGCADNTGRNAIHANVLAGELASQGPGKLRQSALCDPVCEGAQAAAEARCRAKKDDGPLALLRHVGNGSPRKVKNGVNMDGEGAHPCLFRDLMEPAGGMAAGRVDQNIKTSKLLSRLIDTALAGFGIAHVSLHKTDVETVPTTRREAWVPGVPISRD